VGVLLGGDQRLVLDLDQHTFNVFHVPEAKGSSYIPAQRDFVIPYSVCSVVGFGGLLPDGELFATILFSRVPVARGIADLFRPLALNLKLAMLPFVGRKVFA
jgi:two-component system, NtrC family, sensor kinase